MRLFMIYCLVGGNLGGRKSCWFQLNLPADVGFSHGRWLMLRYFVSAPGARFDIKPPAISFEDKEMEYFITRKFLFA